jgi:hypothetical protein
MNFKPFFLKLCQRINTFLFVSRFSLNPNRLGPHAGQGRLFAAAFPPSTMQPT